MSGMMDFPKDQDLFDGLYPSQGRKEKII